MLHAQASDWEVEAAVHLLDAFHTVKGPPLEELAQVSLLSWLTVKNPAGHGEERGTGTSCRAHWPTGLVGALDADFECNG